MTNLERWRNYMRDVNSPDTFIDMGFYYMINATLQRRVWVNPDHTPLFPNMYVVLVGGPAVGKGRVVKPVTEFLKYWNVADLNKDPLKLIDKKDQSDAAAIEALQAYEEKMGNKVTKTDKPPKPLIPIAADATTYEALLKSMANNICVNEKVTKTSLSPTGTYIHKSMAFSLEEMSSLVKHKAKDVMDFMLKAYDCGDYNYETKHHGKDKLRKVCLNFFAGTTPNTMQKSMSQDILDDGFSSRTIFVYEFSARKNQFGIFEHDEEQKEDRKQILKQIHSLGKIFGRVEYTEEAYAYLKYYFEEVLPDPTKGRVNDNIKLDSYYGRKNMHVPKMAMAVHFADKTDMLITLDEVEKAVEILNHLEHNMHYALAFGGNPIAPVSKKIIQSLRQGKPKTHKQLWMEFTDELREDEFREAMRYVEATGLVMKQIIDNQNTYIFTGGRV